MTYFQSFHPQYLFRQMYVAFSQASQGQTIPFLTLAATIGVCSILYAFFGYKIYRWVLALTGALLGVFLGLFLTDFLPVPPANLFYVQLTICGILGLVGSIAAPKLFHLLTFLLGGTAIALVISPMQTVLQPPTNWIILITCFVAGGFLAFWIMRPILILSTSIAGSFLLTTSLFSLILHMHILPARFDFLLFYGVWFLLGIFAAISQLQQQTPSHLEQIG